MGRFERGNQTFGARQGHERLQAGRVVDGVILGAAQILEIGMLRPHAGVVESGGDGIHRIGLALLHYLQQIGTKAVQRAGLAVGERGRMLAGLATDARGLYAHQTHARIIDEAGKNTHRVRSTAHAGRDHIGQLARLLRKLLARFAANDRLELGHHHREGVRTDHRADGVEEMLGVAQIFVEGAVHGIFERLGAAIDAHHLGAENLHLGDIGVFLSDVDLAHVDFARQPDQRAGRGQRHAMLPGAGFRQHLGLAHVLGQQRLAQTVIDLVRAGMVEVFALEPDARAAAMRGQAFGQINRAGATDIMGIEIIQLAAVSLGVADGQIGAADVVHDGLEMRRQVLAAVGPEVAVDVRLKIDGWLHAKSP